MVLLRVLRGLRLLPDPQPHFVSRLKSQPLIQRTPLMAGVKKDIGETLVAAPLQNGLHDFASDSPASVFRIGVYIQDGDSPAQRIARMAQPFSHKHATSSNHLP